VQLNEADRLYATGGFFYVVTNPHFADCIKVGMTCNPRQRLAQYNAYCPQRAFKFELLLACPHGNMPSGLLERNVLYRFNRYRLGSREWMYGVTVEDVRRFVSQYKSLKEVK
jgi:hypothetical protein